VINVNVADSIYCSPFNLVCQAIEWWASAASWAQAVLSALAIYWAARIAIQQHRRDLFQRVSVIYQLLKVTCSVAAANSEHMDQCARKQSPFSADVEYFNQLVQSLKQVPLQELPDGRLTHVVAGITRFAEKSGALFTYADSRGKGNVPPSNTTAKECSEHVKWLWRFHAQAVAVRLDYERKLVVFGFPGYWKWLRKKRKISKAPIEPKITVQ